MRKYKNLVLLVACAVAVLMLAGCGNLREGYWQYHRTNVQPWELTARGNMWRHLLQENGVLISSEYLSFAGNTYYFRVQGSVIELRGNAYAQWHPSPLRVRRGRLALEVCNTARPARIYLRTGRGNAPRV